MSKYLTGLMLIFIHSFYLLFWVVGMLSTSLNPSLPVVLIFYLFFHLQTYFNDVSKEFKKFLELFILLVYH